MPLTSTPVLYLNKKNRHCADELSEVAAEREDEGMSV
jgi:hypothetical protein